MSTPTRIYVVTDKTSGTKRLVRSANPSQAVRHTVKDRFVAEVASQDDLFVLLTGGVTVETPTAEEVAQV